MLIVGILMYLSFVQFSLDMRFSLAIEEITWEVPIVYELLYNLI